MNEEESKLALIIGGLLLIAVFVAGSFYDFATHLSTTFGDCQQTVSEDVVGTGMELLFTSGARPALAEGVKIGFLLLGLVGLVLVLGMGVTQYIYRRQTSRRRRAYSSGGPQQYSGMVYTVGVLALLLGLGVATSLAVKAQTACVGGFL